MSKREYVYYNVVIFLIFVGFYLYPGIESVEWVTANLPQISPIIIVPLVGLFQFILAFVLYKFRREITQTLVNLSKFVSSNKFWVLIFVCFFLFFLALGIKRHLNLTTAIYDFALEQQVVWNTSQGRFFKAGVEVENYLGDHISLLTVFPALIYYFLPSPFTLITIQVVCVLLAAFSLVKFSRREKHNPWLTLAIFLCYIFYIGLTGLLLSDYRAVVIAIPFLAWGIYYLEEAKYKKIAFLLLVLGSLGKEDMALFVGTLGLYRLIKFRDKTSLVLMVWGFALAILGVFVFIPYFRGQESDTLIRYEGFSSLFLMLNLKITYLIRLFFPVLFLPFLSPKKLWVLLPSLILNLASVYTSQISALNQYDIATGLVVFWSLLFSLKHKFVKRKLYHWLCLLLIVNILLLSGHSFRRHISLDIERYNDYLFIQNLQTEIPDGAVIAATMRVGGQFGQREHLQLLNEDLKPNQLEPDYIIIDKLADYSLSTDPVVQKKYLEYMQKGYLLKAENTSFVILQKPQTEN